MLQMCSFDGSKSTKGASKLRRDLINAEIANLRDLLPLPSSTRQRLSQLQLMALVCVYVRKSNYFQQVFRKFESSEVSIPNFGFSKALSGFLIMMTQNGKLLYISDNAAEYLGHSMEDLLIHGDSVYDIIDKADHAAVQSELLRGSPAHAPWEERMFLCRMNVSRNARRQMRFGDQKVVLIRGHFLSFLPLCSRNEPVFLATCSPVAMPETRECVVQGTTAIFTSLHSMDMKFIHIDTNGEYHLGTSGESIQGSSWYQFLHCDNLKEAQHKHRMITQAETDRACILLVRMQSHLSSIARWLWVHVVLQVKDNMEGVQHPVIVCTNQVLSEREAEVMRGNSWLYHYYAVHNKLNYMDSPRDGSSSDTPHPPPPPPPIIPQAPPPALHQSLLLPVAYPLDAHSLPHYRHPNGGHHQHHQGRTSSAPTYTRLDNCWPALHLSGEEGGALVTHVVTHARHALNVSRKCVYSEYAEEEEPEEEAFSPLQHVPDILHNAFNNNKYSGGTSGAQHVPQCASLVLDRWHASHVPAADERQRCCLCNINTCLALCTCCRQHSAWSFCCTSGAMACSDEEEEEEARKKAEKKQKRNSEKA